MGLKENIHIDFDGNILEFKSSIPFFLPYLHVPPTNSKNYLNISPLKGYTFSVCKSMQNVQVLTCKGNFYKYICEYIEKLMKIMLLL